jgi:hypothetical protein
MILFMVVALASARLSCETVCCGEVCEEVCCEACFPYACPDLGLGLVGSGKGKDCMRQFLLAETEVRLLFYYIQYYGIAEIFQQLKVVLRRLPVFHADCNEFFNSFYS